MLLYNLESGQAYLGACLSNNAAIFEPLQAVHFYDASHQNIYMIMCREMAAGKTVSPVTLNQLLDDEPSLQDIGGAKYLARLAGAAVSIIHSPQYAEIIIELWKRREIIRIARESIEGAGEDNDLDDVLNGLTSALHSVSQSAEVGRGLVHISDTLGEVLDSIASDEPDTTGVTTGLRALDDSLGLLRPGQSIVLAGRPGMGKTAAALGMAKGAAKAGHGVAFFSQEMPRKDLSQRLLSDVIWSSTAPIPYRDIMRHSVNSFLLDEYQKFRLKEGVNNIKNWPLFIEDQSSMSVAGIYARCQELRHRLKNTPHSLDIVFIDYLGLMKSSGNHKGNRVQEVGELSRDIKELAKRLAVPVVVLAQLNRGVEGRENKRPILSDLRDIGEIEQDADTVIFIYRDEYYLKMEKPSDDQAEVHQAKIEAAENKMELIIAKQQNGETRTRYFFSSIENNVVRDMAHG
ncbi:MAG: replicative DNA helicase [Emcibacter sp.]|nr:replicative DNA helicase [Emcibacter sp.]